MNKKCEENHVKYGRKEDFLQEVLKDWGGIKNYPDAVKKYLEHCPPSSKKIVWSSFVNMISPTLVSQLFLTSQIIHWIMISILSHKNMSWPSCSW